MSAWKLFGTIVAFVTVVVIMECLFAENIFAIRYSCKLENRSVRNYSRPSLFRELIDSKYPCNVLNNYATTSEKFECLPMETAKGKTTMCIYPIEEDVNISHELKINHRRWEDSSVRLMEKYFSEDEDLHLLDVGSNLGAFALSAAKYGRKTVAVDANINNLIRLRRAMQMEHFEHDIILVNNAISDKHMRIRMDINPRSPGASHAQAQAKEKDLHKVDAVYLDDLLQIIPFKRVFFKIDIESNEVAALRRANILFRYLEIPYVFIEWAHIKNDKMINDTAYFMYSMGYVPYRPDGVTKLEWNQRKFTHDVLFKKEYF